MAKNGQKIVEIFLGVSHMINNNIFNIFEAIFGHFYPISLEKLAISPKTRIRQFGQNQILTPTGK